MNPVQQEVKRFVDARSDETKDFQKALQELHESHYNKMHRLAVEHEKALWGLYKDAGVSYEDFFRWIKEQQDADDNSDQTDA